MKIARYPLLLGCAVAIVIGIFSGSLVSGKRASHGHSASAVEKPSIDEKGSSNESVSRSPKFGDSDPKTAFPPGASADERAFIEAGIEQCRTRLNAIELSHAEAVLETKKTRCIRLYPPTQEELDSIYTDLTKVADTFPKGSPAKEEFGKRATALIREYGIDDNPGRLVFFREESSKSGFITVMEFTGGDAEIFFPEEDVVNISSDTTHTYRVPSQRYQHLVQ